MHPRMMPLLVPRDAAEAMTDGDDYSVPSDDRVGTFQPLRCTRSFRALARKPSARFLVEEHDFAAIGMDVALGAEVEQRIERVAPDASLLHASARVRREKRRIHGALLAQQREDAKHDERRQCDEQIERESHRVFLLSGQSGG